MYSSRVFARNEATSRNDYLLQCHPEFIEGAPALLLLLSFSGVGTVHQSFATQLSRAELPLPSPAPR